jgi:hypothetical protein
LHHTVNSNLFSPPTISASAISPRSFSKNIWLNTSALPKSRNDKETVPLNRALPSELSISISNDRNKGGHFLADYPGRPKLTDQKKKTASHVHPASPRRATIVEISSPFSPSFPISHATFALRRHTLSSAASPQDVA